ncbi:MAG: endonuclease III [Treponemataceae bacterium]|nr:endonuclease III [Treponemataceae bacterium]
MQLLSEDQIVDVMERFKARNPDPKSELAWKDPYTLLVSVVLSAQATDKSVNLATEKLYAVADTPQKILALGVDGLIPYIKSIGLYRTKAEHVIALSRKLLDEFGGNVPHDRDALMTLPGVGRKTANVVLNVVWNEPTMPVDTHLLRICPKIGLAEGTTPAQVEQSLLARIPPQYLNHAHHWLILHGRYVCTARNPRCADCFLQDVCKHNA